VPHFLRVLGLRQATTKAVGRERSANEVLEAESRLGIYGLLRLTALRPRELSLAGIDPSHLALFGSARWTFIFGFSGSQRWSVADLKIGNQFTAKSSIPETPD
jgi:hypothetical protein